MQEFLERKLILGYDRAGLWGKKEIQKKGDQEKEKNGDEAESFPNFPIILLSSHFLLS